jgi:DNA-binding response OmpR family regulator
MKQILVIDDEPRIRSVYRQVLTERGFTVFEAFNVRVAHEVFLKESIDLVLLDIKMPIVDGVSIYDYLRTSYQQTRVIVASVYPVEEQKKLIEDASDYYDKSQGIDVLLSKIDRVLAIAP